MNKWVPIILLGLASNVTFAGPAVDNAQAHFNSIAAGDINSVVSQYQDDATLHWVGGPLDGIYSGKQRLTEVWNKFTKAQGAMQVKVMNVTEHANPKGSTVTADVFFSGNKTVPVHYVLSYRDNRLVNEIWQISPALAK